MAPVIHESGVDSLARHHQLPHNHPPGATEAALPCPRTVPGRAPRHRRRRVFLRADQRPTRRSTEVTEQTATAAPLAGAVAALAGFWSGRRGALLRPGFT